MAAIRPDLTGVQGRHLLCAVSGGADSVALLRLLSEARDRGEISLSAAHFEHGIRGEESLGDMLFARDLCERLNVPFYADSASVPDEAAKTGMGLEECARELRHAFLRRVKDEINADYIALAHHLRDRAETVLMHLLRGGGITGAAAMPRLSGYLIRPLIEYTPEELREYLASVNQDWREDKTNFIPDNPRNALRLEVFPKLADIYPGFERALYRFSEISAREDEYISSEADRFISNRVRRFAGIAVIPSDADEAILFRAAKRFLPRECGYEDVKNACSAAGMRDVCEGTRAYGDGKRVYIIPPMTMPEETCISLNGSAALKGICTVSAEACESVPVRNNGYTQVLNREAVKGCTLRLRSTGDFMAPLGMKGRQKLVSDILTDKKIPLPFRDRIPVLAKGDEIMWICGVCVSEHARVDEKTAAVRLKVNMEDTDYDA